MMKAMGKAMTTKGQSNNAQLAEIQEHITKSIEQKRQQTHRGQQTHEGATIPRRVTNSLRSNKPIKGKHHVFNNNNGQEKSNNALCIQLQQETNPQG